MSVTLALVAGCSDRQSQSAPRTAVTSATSTQAVAGGGVRATVVSHGLRFSAEITSTTLATNTAPLVVHLRLTNVSAKPIHFDQVQFGWSTVETDNLIGVAAGGDIGLGAHSPELTLRPGETTSVVRAAGLGGGTREIVAFYGGAQGDPEGRTPQFVVHVAGPLALIGDPFAGPVGAVDHYFYLRAKGRFAESRTLWWKGTLAHEGQNLLPGAHGIISAPARVLSRRAHLKYGKGFAQVVEIVEQIARIGPPPGLKYSHVQKRYVIVARMTASTPWRIVEISKVP